MLADPYVDRRQLFDLVARRLTDRDPFALAEDVPAAAALRPVLDDLIDGPRGQQGTPVTLVAILGAAFAPDGSLLRDGAEGGSELGGAEEFREERFSLHSSSVIRSSRRATRSSKR
jgi:hypothetical protein